MWGKGCPPTRSFVQNEWSAFFKDDWKLKPSLSLNLGARYEYYAVPWEENGFTGSPVGGGNAVFGWTGRNFADYWRFGPQKGDLTAIELVGPNSPNPGRQLHKDDWNNFAPAVGFSWSLPWFGKDRTTVRGGYGLSYIGTGGRASGLDAAVAMAPGITDSQTVPSATYLDLSNARLPVARNKPLQPIPLTQRNQALTGYDPNLINAYIQTLNFSVTRNLHRNVIMDLRYIGTKGTKLYGSVPINQPNYLTNGLLEALNITRAGGDAPLFDQMLKGLNIAGAGFGPVGTTFNGVLQTGSMHLRQSNTYRGNIANGNFTAVANSLNASTQITGQGGGLIRNGGFPENFIVSIGHSTGRFRIHIARTTSDSTALSSCLSGQAAGSWIPQGGCWRGSSSSGN